MIAVTPVDLQLENQRVPFWSSIWPAQYTTMLPATPEDIQPDRWSGKHNDSQQIFNLCSWDPRKISSMSNLDIAPIPLVWLGSNMPVSTENWPSHTFFANPEPD